jgi:hypothetical protein
MARDGATGCFVLSTNVVPAYPDLLSGLIRPGPTYETRMTSIERCTRHSGAPVCDGAEGAILTTDPGESEDAGHHGDGGSVRLPQPVDRKCAASVAQGRACVEYHDRRDVVRGVALPAQGFLGAVGGSVPAAVSGATAGMDSGHSNRSGRGDSVIRVAEPGGLALPFCGLRGGHRVLLSYPGHRLRRLSYRCLVA